MKKLKRNLILVILLTGGLLAFSECTKESTNDGMQSQATTKSIEETNSTLDESIPDVSSTATLTPFCSYTCITSLPVEPLSASEITSLNTMREEELLARDVYVALYSLYKIPVFNNISKAETQHTEAVKTLLLKYSLPDPAVNHVAGTFVNADLQALYTSLVAQGSTSLIGGFTVGATIEDLDINDLHNHILVDVDNQDILFVYNNLEKGSRNHLRSFYRLLKVKGVTYTPQYIALEYFSQIISTPHETGPVVCPN